jgi:hypothetical protein
VQRILDLDLDFFVQGAAYWRDPGSDRLDPQEFPPWPRDDALAFLHDRCHLAEPLPGIAVENHGELFAAWRAAIDRGALTPPFSVTHVDAHADLGLGDSGYVFLLTELLFLPVANRFAESANALTDGNWLAFSIACRWLSDLTYVRNGLGGGRPGDLMPYFMENADLDAAAIQLPALTGDQLDQLAHNHERVPSHLEPRVPLLSLAWRDFQAAEPFDMLCIARSPGFTPAELDPRFEEIRQCFIAQVDLG